MWAVDLCVLAIGISIGSFLNVCIFRVPAGEDIVCMRSHCRYCQAVLKWYELIPVISFVVQGGKCKNCGRKLPVQYPVIELANGFFYVLIIHGLKVCPVSILYCLCVSALLVLAVIDFQTYEIPRGCNLFIGVLGVIRLFLDLHNWQRYAVGFFAVSAGLFVLYFLTKGKGIGGGDIKLMAAAGLLLGWEKILLALAMGSALALGIHTALMIFKTKGSVLAFGPYLAAGIFFAMLYGI